MTDERMPATGSEGETVAPGWTPPPLPPTVDHTAGTAAAPPPLPPTVDHAAGADAAPPARRRGSRRGLVISLVSLGVFILVAAGFTLWSVLSIQRYADDLASLQTAGEDHRLAVAANSARIADATSLRARLDGVTASSAFGRDAAAEADTVRASTDQLRAAIDSSPAFSARDVSAYPPLDGWRPPWELDADSSRIEAEAASLDADTSAASANDDALAGLVSGANGAEQGYFGALASAGQATIDTHQATSYEARFALADLIDTASDPAQAGTRDGAFVDAFASAQDAVVAADAEELAERADPSLAVRKEIEDYANSIARGVQLDIDWAPEVSGLGEGWLSGTTQYMPDHGGWAIINLNYTIEDAWNDGLNDRDAMALVTHEVGHAQVLRPECGALYRGPVFGGDDEMWATAWAIAQGFDTDGSGIQAYGRPTDEQIATAAQCP